MMTNTAETKKASSSGGGGGAGDDLLLPSCFGTAGHSSSGNEDSIVPPQPQQQLQPRTTTRSPHQHQRARMRMMALLAALAVVGYYLLDAPRLVRYGGGIDNNRIPPSPSSDSYYSACDSLRRAVVPGGGGAGSVPTADSVWASQLERILAASQLKREDPSYAMRDFTAELLQVVSPLLNRSVQTMPRDWSSVRRLLRIVERRWEYLHSSNSNNENQRQRGGAEDEQAAAEGSETPRPLRVVVLGGSVTKGSHCRKMALDGGVYAQFLKNNKARIQDLNDELCGWPGRLQNLIDNWSGMPGLVRITNLSIGGTGTIGNM